MSGVLFEHPEWAMACGVAVTIAAALLVGAHSLARRRVRTLLGEFGKLRVGAIRSDLMLFGALLLVAIALLGPRIGERSVLVSTRGADVVFLFDTSLSMAARDVAPSRMLRARAAAAELLERLEPEDRAALAAFAGRGVLLTPLTPDAAALREMLPALDTSLIRPHASDLDAGVRTALEAFDPASDRPRLLVVLSDGESADRDLSGAATAAARQQVRVLVAAIGTAAGATVPYQGSELRDSTGHVVVSRRRSAPLAMLADATDGRVFEGDEWGEFDLASLTREIGRDARGRPGELVERRVAAPLVWPFAAGAFALALLELLPAAVWPHARRAWLQLGRTLRGSARPAAALCALLLILAPRPGPAEPEASRVASDATRALEALARRRPLSPTELLQRGRARARDDRWDEAENSFLAAAMLDGRGSTAAIAYHDLGVAALRRSELERARDFFFDSLALRPGDSQTRFNLEWTIAALSVAAPRDRDESPKPPPLPSSEMREDETRELAQDRQDTPAKPEPSADDAAPQNNATMPELSEAQRERWIERIQDDPSKALLSAARAGADDLQRSRRRDTPAW